jgi:hypothetical protein
MARSRNNGGKRYRSFVLQGRQVRTITVRQAPAKSFFKRLSHRLFRQSVKHLMVEEVTTTYVEGQYEWEEQESESERWHREWLEEPVVSDYEDDYWYDDEPVVKSIGLNHNWYRGRY